jgi:hypothetical protein
MSNPAPESVGDSLWVQARRDRAVGRLLERALLDPILSRVFLLHRDELFPTFPVTEGNLRVLAVAAPGFPYVTDTFEDTLRGLRRLETKYERHSPEARQIGRAQRRTQELCDSVGRPLGENLIVAALNTEDTEKLVLVAAGSRIVEPNHPSHFLR